MSNDDQFIVEYTFGTHKFYAVQDTLPSSETVFYLTVDGKQFYVDEGSLETRRKVWKQRRDSSTITSAEFFTLPNSTRTTQVNLSGDDIRSVNFAPKEMYLVKIIYDRGYSFGLFRERLDDLPLKLVQTDVDTWKLNESCHAELRNVETDKYHVFIDGKLTSLSFTPCEEDSDLDRAQVRIEVKKTTLGDISHELVIGSSTVVVGSD